jgi:hypothetical protein
MDTSRKQTKGESTLADQNPFVIGKFTPREVPQILARSFATTYLGLANALANDHDPPAKYPYLMGTSGIGKTHTVRGFVRRAQSGALASIIKLLAGRFADTAAGLTGLDDTAWQLEEARRMAYLFAEFRRFEVVSRNLPTLQPEDFAGLPSIVTLDDPDGVSRPYVEYVPDQIWRIRPPTILPIFVLDEFNRASQPTLKAAMNRLLNGEFPGYVILMGNPIGYEVAALDMAFANRLDCYIIEADASEWVQWAMAVGLHPLVTAFVKQNPSLFACVDAEGAREGRPSPVPRCMHQLANHLAMLEATGEDYDPRTAIAIIGNQGGQMFNAFREEVAETPLPDPEEVLQGRAQLPSAVGAALVTGLAVIGLALDKRHSPRLGETIEDDPTMGYEGLFALLDQQVASWHKHPQGAELAALTLYTVTERAGACGQGAIAWHKKGTKEWAKVFSGLLNASQRALLGGE